MIEGISMAGEPEATTQVPSAPASGAAAPAPAAGGVAFTQEQVTAIVAREVAEAARKASKDVVTGLGFESKAAAEAFVKAQRDAELATLSDAQRAKAEADAAKAAAEALLADAKAERLNAAVVAELQRAGAQGDLGLLARMVAAADTDAVAAAVADVKARVPGLFAAPVPSSEPAGGGAPASRPGQPTAFERGREEARRRLGRTTT